MNQKNSSSSSIPKIEYSHLRDYVEEMLSGESMGGNCIVREGYECLMIDASVSTPRILNPLPVSYEIYETGEQLYGIRIGSDSEKNASHILLPCGNGMKVAFEFAAVEGVRLENLADTIMGFHESLTEAVSDIMTSMNVALRMVVSKNAGAIIRTDQLNDPDLSFLEAEDLREVVGAGEICCYEKGNGRSDITLFLDGLSGDVAMSFQVCNKLEGGFEITTGKVEMRNKNGYVKDFGGKKEDLSTDDEIIAYLKQEREAFRSFMEACSNDPEIIPYER